MPIFSTGYSDGSPFLFIIIIIIIIIIISNKKKGDRDSLYFIYLFIWQLNAFNKCNPYFGTSNIMWSRS